VGDTVNLAQRLQDLARPAGRIVMNESTYDALTTVPDCEAMGETLVKGRTTPVHAWVIDVSGDDREGTR
ncbi:MAG TPA: adenylate/guanylate cyclase domain-containing protein, partial [Acidimicrobiia bacterium]|nr:adenylate/guanylate cyclase domain-containing protein [Acidimicrobiia bacterium]